MEDNTKDFELNENQEFKKKITLFENENEFYNWFFEQGLNVQFDNLDDLLYMINNRMIDYAKQNYYAITNNNYNYENEIDLIKKIDYINYEKNFFNKIKLFFLNIGFSWARENPLWENLSQTVIKNQEKITSFYLLKIEIFLKIIYEKETNQLFIKKGIKYLSINECKFDNVKKLYLPNTLSKIEKKTFSEHKNIEEVYYDGSIEEWCQIDFCDGKANPLYFGAKLYVNNDKKGWELITDINLNNKIKAIKSYSFVNYLYLKSAAIPDSVTTIGKEAFYGCSSLTSITLPFVGEEVDGSGETHFGYIFGASSYDYNDDYVPSSLKEVIITGGTTIERYAFYNCSSLTSITIPNGVKSIENYAFYGCSSLFSIEIPNSVTSIDYRAFENCSSLSSIEIPNSVTTIGKEAFCGCSSLTSITLPFVGEEVDGSGETHFGYIFGALYYHNNKNCVPTSLKEVIITGGTTIGDMAFYDCSSLISIEIPERVTTIKRETFHGCTSLISIVIPNSVTSIDYRAFENCSSLSSIVIPNSVTTIERYAFRGCTSLISIEIPNSVTSIGAWAFYDCSSLTNITIPNSVTTIGKEAFYGCRSLTSIEIPERVVTIGDSTFCGCRSLISIEIPNSVTTIERYAFYGCRSLTSIEIPNSVTTIKREAFHGCTSLISIEIPNSVKTIRYNVFYGCTTLTSIVIPNSVTSIENDAFYGCRSLTIYCEVSSKPSGWKPDWNPSNRPVYWGVNTLITGIEKNGIQYSIINGKAVLLKYVGTDTSVVIPSTIEVEGLTYDVTTIGYRAFYNCSSLTSIEIPNSVTTIGKEAFNGCSSLTIYCETTNYYWNISDRPVYRGVNTLITGIEQNGIQYSIINGKAVLLKYVGTDTKVVIPSTIEVEGTSYDVTTIGENAFNGCTSLISIEIPNSVTTMGDRAFSGCIYLKSIEIPDSVTTIGISAFEDCDSLTSVTIGNSVTTIGDSAFSGCYNLFIYCEAPSEPSGWDIDWNCSNRLVYWGVNTDTLITGIEKNGIKYSIINGEAVVIKYVGTDTEVVIPSTIEVKGSSYDVTTIGYRAFYDCSSLTSIEIPNSVTTIGKEAFNGCSSLKSIVIPNSVTTIGSGVFYNCGVIDKVYCTNPLLIKSFINTIISKLYYLKNVWSWNEIKKELYFSNSIDIREIMISIDENNFLSEEDVYNLIENKLKDGIKHMFDVKNSITLQSLEFKKYIAYISIFKDSVMLKKSSSITKDWKIVISVAFDNSQELDQTAFVNDIIELIKKQYAYLLIRSELYIVGCKINLSSNSNNELLAYKYDNEKGVLFINITDNKYVKPLVFSVDNIENEMQLIENKNKDAIDCVKAYDGSLDIYELTQDKLNSLYPMIDNGLKQSEKSRILIEGPARSGKTIIVFHLLKKYPQFVFLLMNAYFYYAIRDAFSALNVEFPKERIFHHDLTSGRELGCGTHKGNRYNNYQTTFKFNLDYVIIDEAQRLTNLPGKQGYIRYLPGFDGLDILIKKPKIAIFLGDDLQKVNPRHESGFTNIRNKIIANNMNYNSYIFNETIGIPNDLLNSIKYVLFDDNNYLTKIETIDVRVLSDASEFKNSFDHENTNSKHYSYIVSNNNDISLSLKYLGLEVFPTHLKESNYNYFLNKETQNKYVYSAYEMISREVEVMYLIIPSNFSYSKEKGIYDKTNSLPDEFLINHLYINMTRATKKLVIYAEDYALYEYLITKINDCLNGKYNIKENKQKFEQQKINFVITSSDKSLSYKLKEKLESKGFEGFIHAADYMNVCHILEENKLLSRKDATGLFVDIADQDVIVRTTEFVKNKVRFYYKNNTPTLYHFNRTTNNLVILMFDYELVNNYEVFFADGNAASRNTRFYGLIRDALEIDWDTIFSRGPIMNMDNKYDIIRKRNAELLVSGKIDINKYLRKIIVKNNQIKEELQKRFPKYQDIIYVKEEWFE